VQQSVAKPKTFSENLMNVLAKQNIGQAFSENPVEALNVLGSNTGKTCSLNGTQGSNFHPRAESAVS